VKAYSVSDMFEMGWNALTIARWFPMGRGSIDWDGSRDTLHAAHFPVRRVDEFMMSKEWLLASDESAAIKEARKAKRGALLDLQKAGKLLNRKQLEARGWHYKQIADHLPRGQEFLRTPEYVDALERKLGIGQGRRAVGGAK
jgi:hypothetical protein